MGVVEYECSDEQFRVRDVYGSRKIAVGRSKKTFEPLCAAEAEKHASGEEQRLERQGEHVIMIGT